MDMQYLAFTLFLIFAGAAVLSTIGLYTRQPLLVAYIVLGFLLGPYALNWVSEPQSIHAISEIGIIFLLFLLGLHLSPQEVLPLLRRTLPLTVYSSIFIALFSTLLLLFFNFTGFEAGIIGISMVFSSTIVGLKLLPTTFLHHRRVGELMISVLLLQDLLAIIVLLIVDLMTASNFSFSQWTLLLLGLPILLGVGIVVEAYILNPLFCRFDKTQEYIFLISIAWCLTLAELALFLGLSIEVGAFIAGVALAASPIAQFIAENLKPLRDFFLILFFFSIGAGFDFSVLPDLIWPSISLAILILLIKPFIFQFFLKRNGETVALSWEVGTRLGLASEFSLLIGSLALNNSLINERAALCIQTATLLTFIISSYWVVFRYPTPIAVSDKMRRD